MFPYRVTESGNYRLRIVPEKIGSDIEVNMLSLIRYLSSDAGQKLLRDLMFKGQIEEVKESKKPKKSLSDYSEEDKQQAIKAIQEKEVTLNA